MIKDNERNTSHVVVGSIGSPFGVHGWLKIYSYTELDNALLNYQPWYLSDEEQNNKTDTPLTELQLEEGRPHGNCFIAKIAGINSPEEARALTGKLILVKRSQLPTLNKEEYYWSDLQGLTVINQNGVCLGKVIYLIATGSNDVLVVQGEKEFALPYLMNEVVLHIDLEKQEIHVNWEPL
jgi:16S rRNA processing protein RimM